MPNVHTLRLLSAGERKTEVGGIKEIIEIFFS